MTRHSIDPQDTDGGTVTAAIEKKALRMAEEIPFSDFLGRLSVASHQAEQAEKDAEHFRTLAKKAESKLEDALLRACSDPDAHWRLDEALERNEEQADLIESLREDLARAEAVNHEVTDAMIQRAWQVNSDLLPSTIGRMLAAALAEPTRPHGADEIEALVDAWKLVPEHPDAPRPSLPDFLAERGVRVTGGES